MLDELRALLQALLGSGVGPVESKTEKIYAINTAVLTMRSTLQLEPTGLAALTFKQMEASEFQALKDEIAGLLEIAHRETQTEVGLAEDEYSYNWVVLRDPDFEDLVTTMHLASSTLEDRGFGKTLLAALFQFRNESDQFIYWIYNFKRGAFYPFVPRKERTRDNAYELRLKSVMQGELPVEQDLERWYPLWDIPIDRRDMKRTL